MPPVPTNQDIMDALTGLREEMGGMREEMGGMREEMGGMRGEMQQGFARIDHEPGHIRRDIADIQTRVAALEGAGKRRSERLQRA